LVNQTLVLRINICDKNRQLLVAANRYSQLYKPTNMSRSIHKTYKDVKVLTKKELEEQYNDPNSDLAELAKKSSIKTKVLKERKQKKSE